MTLSQGDTVLIRGKIVSVDGNQATVSLSSTDFAIVPLGAIVGPIHDVPFGTGRRSYGRRYWERVTGMKLRVKTSR